MTGGGVVGTGGAGDDGTARAAGVAGAIREVPHVARILRVLGRHGVLGALRGERHWPTPVQVREAIEELGVVFLKFGQVLALRRDLLPDAYVTELDRLHDRVPAVDFSIIRATTEAELGGPLETLFASFDESPMAAATIAQVHGATLADGRHVVVKVRRPGLELRIAEDTATLMYLAATAERFDSRIRALDAVGLVREFRVTLHKEMDLRLEAATIRRFTGALADVKEVWIPDVVPERSGSAVLTLEFSPGERIDRYAEKHPQSSRGLALALARLVLHQVFETGLFHADPHPGNVFVLPDGRLCLHDFGMIGELNEHMRETLTGILAAIVRGDARAAAEGYIALGFAGGHIDPAGLEADLSVLLREIRERPIAEISVGIVLQSLLRVGAEHRLRNPGELLLLVRAFLITEGLMRQLDPSLNVLEVFELEMARVTARRYTPARMLAAAAKLAGDLESVLRDAPVDVRRVLRRLADGDLGQVSAPQLEALGTRASRDIELLTGAVASAALVIGGGLLATVEGWHRTAGDVLLAIGLLGTAVMAVRTVRRRRR